MLIAGSTVAFYLSTRQDVTIDLYNENTYGRARHRKGRAGG